MLDLQDPLSHRERWAGAAPTSQDTQRPRRGSGPAVHNRKLGSSPCLCCLLARPACTHLTVWPTIHRACWQSSALYGLTAKLSCFSPSFNVASTNLPKVASQILRNRIKFLKPCPLSFLPRGLRAFKINGPYFPSLGSSFLTYLKAKTLWIPNSSSWVLGGIPEDS